MPRKQFRADLQKAKDDLKPLGILDINAGDDDGQLEIEYNAPGAGALPNSIIITALIPDVSEYPKSHIYMIFCGEDAPHSIGKALQGMRSTERKTIFELLDIVSTTLASLAPDADGDTFMQDSQADDGLEEDSDDEEYEYDEENDPFAFGAPRVPPATASNMATSSHPGNASTKDRPFRQRIRGDLRAAKQAGFRVGHLGHLLDGYNAFVTISLRIAKLGISEEAMQAWGVDPSEYLILIIQYPNGYKTNEQLQAYDSIRLKPNIGMRVFAGKHYKPTLQEAIKAFTKTHKDQPSASGDDKDENSAYQDTSAIRDTFISRSVARLLEDTLVPILRFRSTGMDWHGAESWYNDSQGAGAMGDPNAIPDGYYAKEEVTRALPAIVTDDHYTDIKVVKHSFPLLAMQFVLRHFVRCTDFCLVCHRKLKSEVEAIKPYVCNNDLCLYQYMAMGFGPSIEHEIMAQPYVVDLLVSFCYSSARSRKLKEFPDGLALMVPPLPTIDLQQAAYPAYDPCGNLATPPDKTTQDTAKEKQTPVPQYEVGFDQERLEVIFYDKPEGGCPVKRGTWIVVRPAGILDPERCDELHCRVAETNFFPTIKVDKPVALKRGPKPPPGQFSADQTEEKVKKDQVATPATPPRYVAATFTTYDQDFTKLNAVEKNIAICRLLDTLPTVKEMQMYLSNRHPSDLISWVQRMSPSATGLLRWIIASNRACIMQVDSGNEVTAEGRSSKKQERLYGMDGYMQFRFAMGAPDKEQRFLSEVRKTTDRLSLNFPTLFAWHGSPIYNWHMIIREGLHFKNTDHGRAYGHGVYHAKDAATSTGYSGMYRGQGNVVPDAWPGSALNISSALALNEIVNATAEFVSHSPYYVVAQLDWIQTRYLFVACAPPDGLAVHGEECEPDYKHPQDPHRTPSGVHGKAIQIPAAAIKSGRLVKNSVERDEIIPSPAKKLKGAFGDPIIVDGNEDVVEPEDETDTEDLEILFDEPSPPPSPLFAPRNDTPAPSTTDFLPDTLDFNTLPLMPLPTYATSATTKRLLTELRNIACLQDAVPPVELGWHIATDKIENVYQWIVELHSFHTFSPELPLAKDMKSYGFKSIVLEIRFGADFPFSPPYIRVVRPHFLPFTQGGGGHVVIGGAMCMELLTNNGWNSVLGMDSVLLQVRMAIASEPFARLDGKGRGDYGVAEAAEGYLRACRAHGWTAPEGFKEVSMGMGDGVGQGF